MKLSKKRQLTGVFTICLVLITIFGTAVFFSGLILRFIPTHVMTGMEQTMVMPCCYFSNADSPIVGLISSHFVMPDNLRFVFVILMIAAGVASFLLVKNEFFCCNLDFYVRQIRDRYGGFKIFEFYLSLFRRGILNPKVF